MNTKLKPIIVAMGMGLALAVGQAKAFTDPATLLPGNSQIQFKYNDLEIVVSAVNDVLNGIVNVTSLGDPSGSPVYWASGLSGSQITGSFQGLTVAEILGGTNIYFTGGTLDLYSVPNGTYAATDPSQSIASQICGGACGTPWLTFDFVPGVVLTDNLTTPLFDETTATLVSTVSSISTPLTGTGDGVLKVTGGTAASTFGIGTVFSLQSNLQSCPDAGGAFGANCQPGAGTTLSKFWPLASFDPMIGKTVPEPGTLFLLGAGLLGAGFASRKRKSV